MYRVCVPLMDNGRSAEDLALLARQLHAASVEEVFLVFDRVLDNPTMLEEKIRSFRATKERLEALGFRVQAWIAPTVGYGGKSSVDNGAPEKYTRIITDKGRVLGGGYCPLDAAFTDDFMRTLTALAGTGVEAIMFEDDYTLSGGKMVKEHGCCCERHMQILREKLGEDISREELSQALYAPDGIRYRKVFLSVMGDTLRTLTRRVEETIHAVDPNIRIGLSANASSFRMEGVSMGELSRLTGAPYWQQVPTGAANIEAIRLQTHWLFECGADLIAEGMSTHVRGIGSRRLSWKGMIWFCARTVSAPVF